VLVSRSFHHHWLLSLPCLAGSCCGCQHVGTLCQTPWEGSRAYTHSNSFSILFFLFFSLLLYTFSFLRCFFFFFSHTTSYVQLISLSGVMHLYTPRWLESPLTLSFSAFSLLLLFLSLELLLLRARFRVRGKGAVYTLFCLRYFPLRFRGVSVFCFLLFVCVAGRGGGRVKGAWMSVVELRRVLLWDFKTTGGERCFLR
jgi:hypothetical protein